MNNDKQIPDAEKGPPNNVWLDQTNRPDEPPAWLDETLEDIIGSEEE